MFKLYSAIHIPQTLQNPVICNYAMCIQYLSSMGQKTEGASRSWVSYTYVNRPMCRKSILTLHWNTPHVLTFSLVKRCLGILYHLDNMMTRWRKWKLLLLLHWMWVHLPKYETSSFYMLWLMFFSNLTILKDEWMFWLKHDHAWNVGPGLWGP